MEVGFRYHTVAAEDERQEDLQDFAIQEQVSQLGLIVQDDEEQLPQHVEPTTYNF